MQKPCYLCPVFGVSQIVFSLFLSIVLNFCNVFLLFLLFSIDHKNWPIEVLAKKRICQTRSFRSFVAVDGWSESEGRRPNFSRSLFKEGPLFASRSDGGYLQLDFSGQQNRLFLGTVLPRLSAGKLLFHKKGGTKESFLRGVSMCRMSGLPP